ncbi:riboflavin synthase, partial [bacterium]|nr:riboflavin synthase [bacterium]
CQKVLENTRIGDSIAINGCCQTVTTIASNTFSANVSDETFKITNFKNMKPGDFVNLERALTPSTRMGGHIVQGHIDCVGKYLGNMHFEVENSKYIVYKGSITVNGVSLTVASLEGNIFSVAVIPHTLECTNLKNLRAGDLVNIETDILGRYVEKFLSTKNNKIDENFLFENGFM